MDVHEELLLDILGSETTKVYFIESTISSFQLRELQLTHTTLSGQEIFQNLTKAPSVVIPPRIYHSLFFNPPIVPALKFEFRLFPPNALGGEPSRSRSRVSASDSTLSLVASGGSGAERGCEGTFLLVADMVGVLREWSLALPSCLALPVYM
jgi:hypothetical protein